MHSVPITYVDRAGEVYCLRLSNRSYCHQDNTTNPLIHNLLSRMIVCASLLSLMTLTKGKCCAGSEMLQFAQSTPNQQHHILSQLINLLVNLRVRKGGRAICFSTTNCVVPISWEQKSREQNRRKEKRWTTSKTWTVHWWHSYLLKTRNHRKTKWTTVYSLQVSSPYCGPNSYLLMFSCARYGDTLEIVTGIDNNHNHNHNHASYTCRQFSSTDNIDCKQGSRAPQQWQSNNTAMQLISQWIRILAETIILRCLTSGGTKSTHIFITGRSTPL